MKRIKAIYYGKITEGKINGYGKKTDFESNIDYEGNFIKGKKSGYGKEYKSSNLVYEGEFCDEEKGCFLYFGL